MVWAGPPAFLPLAGLFLILWVSQIGPISLIVYPGREEEAAEIKEDSLAAEREIDGAKFKRRERSVKAAYLRSVSLPERSVT